MVVADSCIEIETEISIKIQFVDLNDDRLAARAMMVYFETTETSGTSLAFALYELANNPDAQDRLHAEVMEAFEKNNGELTFEALNEMKYLENFLSESLRLHSPATSLGRICKRSFTLPSIGNNPPVIIEPGTIVEIPVQALHL